MPPVRTMPSAKPVKTERTHEENQERAYVAASRRSDRSLEARVESARRASEIHKKRTGRSLRVTEQDVINEEMYEEEDDDLPIQYRRLASHLQTGSASFDRRLAAYLTNHVAMRDALESSIQQSYQQQHFQKTAQPGGGPSPYQSSMVSPQQQQQQMFLQQQAMSQSVSQNMQQQSMQRAIYRQAPYPTPQPTGHHGFRPTPQHQRSASIAIPNEFISSPVTQGDNYRRQSMPTPIIAGMSPIIESEGTPRPAAATIAERRSVPTPTFTQSPSSHFSFMPNYKMGGGFADDFLPFSSALPAESQQLLGDTLDPDNPMTSMLMSGSELLPNYNYSTAVAQTSNTSGGKLGGPQMYPTMDGLNSTLGSMHDDSFLNGQNNEGPGFDGHQSFFEAGLSHSHGGTTSGTPVDDNTGWDLFMNDEVIPTGSQ